MKKILFILGAFASLTMSATAQTRMTLHEEFTGENCPPCASINPGFWTLCNSGTNPSKLIHISYMVPIPSAGWYCNRTSAIYTDRDAYYSVPFAPYGRFDGHVPDDTMSSPGNPYYFTQADIDSEAAVASPFNMTMTSAWNANFDSVVTTINVSCVTAYSGTLFLRTALIHTDNFATPPGTNGESDFQNVVQAMYPSAAGTSITGTWTPGMTNTYTITGLCPSWMDKSGAPYMVAWIQNDVDKRIAQAAKSAALPAVSNDAAVSTVTAPSGIVCMANGPYTLAHTVNLKNTGSATLTSATIFYSIDGGAFTSYSWTGSLAAGASAAVTMPTVSLTITGAFYHSVYDSVGMPNGSVDKNLVNNTGGNSFFIESTTALPLPYNTSYETADNGKFDFTDANNNGDSWGIYSNGTGASLGHTGTSAALFDCYTFAAGETEVMTTPEVATGVPASLTFYTSHTYYTAGSPENDMLEVVYSTDCGANWTSIWSKSGTTLSNVPLTTAIFVPTAAQYVMQTASLNTVPANAIIGFRGTSAWGNNIWVDDISIYSTVGVNEVTSVTPSINIYPNPANEMATLSINLTGSSDVHIKIVDQLGRTVGVVANESMTAGAHTFSINTSSMVNGIYNVMIQTGIGSYSERFTVAK